MKTVHKPLTIVVFTRYSRCVQNSRYTYWKPMQYTPSYKYNNIAMLTLSKKLLLQQLQLLLLLLLLPQILKDNAKSFLVS